MDVLSFISFQVPKLGNVHCIKLYEHIRCVYGMVAVMSYCHGDFSLDNSPSTRVGSLLSEGNVSPHDEHLLYTMQVMTNINVP